MHCELLSQGLGLIHLSILFAEQGLEVQECLFTEWASGRVFGAKQQQTFLRSGWSSLEDASGPSPVQSPPKL